MAESTTTIKDLLIHPFEIDIDKNNYTVVKVKITEAAAVAGRQTEGGKKVRDVVGYYNTFLGAVGVIWKELCKEGLPDLEGQTINIKTFLAQQEKKKKLFVTWCKHFNAPFVISEEDGITTMTPKTFLKKTGKADPEIEE